MSNHNPELIPGPVDGLDPLPHHPPAGDWRDDDGRAIDDFFNTSDPDAGKAYRAVPLPREELPAPTRIIRNRITQTGALFNRAVLALNPDVNRICLVVSGNNSAAAGGFYIASEPFQVLDNGDDNVSNTMGFWVNLDAGSTQLVIPGHTGAVYVAAAVTASNQTVQIDVMAVTR
jgi:hypothetical protein